MTTALRRTRPEDLDFVTRLERREDHREQIGQWSDAQHLAAIAGEATREHWTIEREGARAGYLIAYDGREADGGIYVKRILVDAKERGTGTAALSAFLDEACRRAGARFAWLIVRVPNLRAQAVYRKLGFERWDPEGEAAARADHAGEAPMGDTFRMRIELSAWRSRAR